MSRQLPFMSVVVCTYNGETVVGRSIESLLAQDYPKNRYEIIVIDDGSTDGTAAVVKNYPVRYVHQHNTGLSGARNTGLSVVRGDVYIAFDDDCLVDPRWLRELARGYAMPNLGGVSSFIGHPAHLRGIADHYMAATGSGNPPAITLNDHAGLLRRFVSYVVAQIRPLHLTAGGIIPVRQLNGATGSFPVEILKAVGGWNAHLRNIEDTELCNRIRQQFPDRTFYAVPAAVITHDPKLTFQQLLRRQYVRGGSNLAYYRQNHLVPPLFPFPFAWSLGSLALGLVSPIFGVLAVLLLPSLLYFWWDIRAVAERQPSYIMLPYVQMSEEIAALAGLARGYVNSRRSTS